MTFLIDVLFAALVVVNLCLAGVGRLWGAVRLVAFQGVVIGLLPFVLTGEHALIAVVNVLVKGVLLPVMLNYAIRKARTVRELEPLVGFGKSVAIVFARIRSMWRCRCRRGPPWTRRSVWRRRVCRR